MSNWYVRKTGSDNNGGSSNGAAPDRSGTDMATTNASTQVTSATAAFVAGDVGKGINIAGVIYRIATFTNSTTIQLERAYAGTTGSGRTWAIGGALLTIGKLLGTTAAIMQNGDTLWIGAGTYREAVTFNMTALTATGYIKGDVDGAQTGDAGKVEWSGFTTNDTTAPTASNIVALNTRGFLAFSNIFFVNGTGSIVLSGATPQNVSFTDCAFYSYAPSAGSCISVTGVAGGGTPFNWTIDRCTFLSMRGNPIIQVSVAQAASGSANNDVNFVVKNSLLMSFSNLTAVNVAGAASSGSKPGGVVLRNCTILSGGSGMVTSTAWSTTVPCVVDNCAISAGATPGVLVAGTAGQITENYNVLQTQSATKLTNVTPGANSISDSSNAFLFHFGQERVWGGQPRLLGEPTVASPLLAFGNDGNQSAYDARNNPRPSGGSSASPGVGSLERGNTWAKETGTVRTGSNALSITGPGYQDFALDVDAAATTVEVYARYDATYAGTKPQLRVLAGTECGVADATASFGDGTSDADPGSGAWGKLKLVFTPTAKGVVTIRLLSNDTNGGGKAFADDRAVS